jgi:hypothetical protein
LSFGGGEQNEAAGRVKEDYVLHMVDPIHILTVVRDDPDGVIMTFSDGTTAAYVVEELVELRPPR